MKIIKCTFAGFPAVLVFAWRGYDIFTRFHGVIIVIVGDVERPLGHIEQLAARDAAAPVDPCAVGSRKGSVHCKFYFGAEVKVHGNLLLCETIR